MEVNSNQRTFTWESIKIRFGLTCWGKWCIKFRLLPRLRTLIKKNCIKHYRKNKNSSTEHTTLVQNNEISRPALSPGLLGQFVPGNCQLRNETRQLSHMTIYTYLSPLSFTRLPSRTMWPLCTRKICKVCSADAWRWSLTPIPFSSCGRKLGLVRRARSFVHELLGTPSTLILASSAGISLIRVTNGNTPLTTKDSSRPAAGPLRV